LLSDTLSSISAQAVFIEAPRHPNLRLLFEYWTSKRAGRAAPSRADINPSQIKSVLADVMIWNVGEHGQHTIRLVGENVVRFVGRNNTGELATAGMTPEAAAIMSDVLNQVVETRSSRFRAGKAFWHRQKSYRDFEACYLPLSSDGKKVDKILGGIMFEMNGPA
jgi:hypothetical protein